MHSIHSFVKYILDLWLLTLSFRMKKNYYLISKRERWGPTWIGCVFMLFLVLTSSYALFKNIVPFLTRERTIHAKVLVIEGYLEDYAYQPIISLIKDIQPEMIITTGTSFDQGFYLTGIPSAAHLVGNSLIALGIDSTLVHIVPVNPDVVVNRTYTSALVSKNYIKKNFPGVKQINLVSTSIHSRRSHYLFKMVFEPGIQVGNIVISSNYLRNDNWYKTSRGFRAVLSETLAWLYVRLFFKPDVKKDIESIADSF